MKFGLTPEQFKILDEIVIAPIKKHGAELFVFGSRAKGTHHPFSDIDIMFRLPANAAAAVIPISEIKEAIEESRLPFAVDLVAESDLAESYRQAVLATMKPL